MAYLFFVDTAFFSIPAVDARVLGRDLFPTVSSALPRTEPAADAVLAGDPGGRARAGDVDVGN